VCKATQQSTGINVTKQSPAPVTLRHGNQSYKRDVITVSSHKHEDRLPVRLIHKHRPTLACSCQRRGRDSYINNLFLLYRELNLVSNTGIKQETVRGMYGLILKPPDF
jgi:hypothetical protein